MKAGGGGGPQEGVAHICARLRAYRPAHTVMEAEVAAGGSGLPVALRLPAKGPGPEAMRKKRRQHEHIIQVRPPAQSPGSPCAALLSADQGWFTRSGTSLLGGYALLEPCDAVGIVRKNVVQVCGSEGTPLLLYLSAPHFFTCHFYACLPTSLVCWRSHSACQIPLLRQPVKHQLF